MRIAVIIPARNEAARLPATIDSIRSRGAADRVIVVDSASRDGTGQVAAAADAELVGGSLVRSRAQALRAGAAYALSRSPRPDVLWFVHADSKAPRAWDASIRLALRDKSVLGGGFEFAWNLREAPWHARPALGVVAFTNRVRSRLTRIFYGDQGIFVRAAAYQAVGGFPDVDLMEDRILCRNLLRRGRLRLAAGRIRTSPRRFVRHGVIRQALYDVLLLASDTMGLKPRRLIARYNDG